MARRAGRPRPARGERNRGAAVAVRPVSFRAGANEPAGRTGRAAVGPGHRAPLRARQRLSTNTVTAANYLDLSGADVIVGVNDTGIEAAHPDLADRVEGFPFDLTGHG